MEDPLWASLRLSLSQFRHPLERKYSQELKYSDQPTCHPKYSPATGFFPSRPPSLPLANQETWAALAAERAEASRRARLICTGWSDCVAWPARGAWTAWSSESAVCARMKDGGRLLDGVFCAGPNAVAFHCENLLFLKVMSYSTLLHSPLNHVLYIESATRKLSIKTSFDHRVYHN